MKKLTEKEAMTGVVCPNCGRNIIHGAKFCTECGTQLPNHSAGEEPASAWQEEPVRSQSAEVPYAFNRVQQSPTVEKPKRKRHILSWIAVFLFGCSGLAYWPDMSGVLFILLAVYLCPVRKIRETRNRLLPRRWLRVVVGFLLFFLIASTLPAADTGDKEQLSSGSPAAHTSETLQAPAEAVREAEKVFYITFIHRIDEYDGKQIETTIPVHTLFSDGRIRTEVPTGTTKYVSLENGEKDFYEKMQGINFVTVRGIVEANGMDILLREPEVISFGEDAPNDYLEDLREYEEMIIQAKIAEREEFIGNAQTVSYEDLRRNPDTYTGQPLRMTIYITEVEVDGWLFPGTIWAQYNGHEVVVQDNREIREPRLMNGDTITVFAEGNGLTTVKTYEKGTGIFGSDIGANVVKEREEICVSMRYTEKDDVSKFQADTQNAEESDYYYQMGYALGEKIKNKLAD